MKINAITAQDINGAISLWHTHVTEKLGYDDIAKIEVSFVRNQCDVFIGANDKFQASLEYSKRIGRCAIYEHFKLTDDWSEACKLVWERLGKCMKRDEREIRGGLQAMGSVLESDFTSEVGKMFAARIRKARDEATNHMIEHHGWQPQAVE